MSNCFISYSLHGLLQSLTVLKEDAKPLVFWWLGTRTFWLVGGYGRGEECRPCVGAGQWRFLFWGKDHCLEVRIILWTAIEENLYLIFIRSVYLSVPSGGWQSMSLCSMFLIWLLIYILMEWPSGKMLGESLHPKSIRNQSCQILFHVKCFQFASASHQDIRMFLTGERSVKIMSGASSNSAWTRSRGVLWIEEVSCSLWRAEGQE